MNIEALSVIQIILSIALTGLVLLQVKGTGLGSTFGGELGFYRTKRGVEKLFFYLTILVAALLITSSVISLLAYRL